ncbi:MAG: hypothetical protein GY847_07700 [Proteobacteria bacterium]|nr:hypothetical protein [Pseudomonadota bacterium]
MPNRSKEKHPEKILCNVTVLPLPNPASRSNGTRISLQPLTIVYSMLIASCFLAGTACSVEPTKNHPNTVQDDHRVADDSTYPSSLFKRTGIALAGIFCGGKSWKICASSKTGEGALMVWTGGNLAKSKSMGQGFTRGLMTTFVGFGASDKVAKAGASKLAKVLAKPSATYGAFLLAAGAGMAYIYFWDSEQDREAGKEPTRKEKVELPSELIASGTPNESVGIGIVISNPKVLENIDVKGQAGVASILNSISTKEEKAESSAGTFTLKSLGATVAVDHLKPSVEKTDESTSPNP